MPSPPSLEDAISLAVRSHAGQLDRHGQPYILHPLRVMLRLTDPTARIVAALHDLIEDTPVTLEDLRRAGYAEEVVAAVDALSRREGEDYEAYIDRLMPNALARAVKRADLTDNMDARRGSGLGEPERERLVRYQKAWDRLALRPEGPLTAG